jgi:dethiobiotin synthetase
VSRARGVFVTGTDTGVGKTLVACAILRGLRARGMDVGAMKPVETGVGRPGPLDALALREASGADDDLADVCPERFALPAAPSVAAAREGRVIDLTRIEACFDAITSRHECVVVEGAGGLLVPLTQAADMADLAARLGLPVVLVARGALGTINHTRLSLEALATRGIALAGVVLSHTSGVLSAAESWNLEALRSELGPRLLGEILPLPPGAEAPAHAIDLDALLRALA